MKIQTKLTISFMLMFFIGMVFLMFVAFNNFDKTYNEELRAHLFDTGRSKAIQIHSFIESQVNRIADFSTDGTIKSCLVSISQNSSECNSEKLSTHLTTAKLPVIRGLLKVSAIDANGTVVASSSKSEIGLDKSTNAYFLSGRENASFVSIDYSFEFSKYVLVASAPVKHQTGNKELIGVVVGEMDLGTLEPILLEKTGLGKTGEILIAFQKGKEIIWPFTNSTISTSTGLNSGKLAIPMKSALTGNETIFENVLDYRGVEVHAISEYLPIEKIGLVVKIDTSEVHKPVIELQEKIIYLGGVILLLNILFTVGLSRSIVSPIKRLTVDVDEISRGKLDTQLQKTDVDEIRDLNSSLTRVLASVKLAVLRVGIAKSDIGLGELKVAKEEAEHKYADLFDSISDSIFIHDMEGHFLEVNKGATENLGYTREELLALGPKKIDSPKFGKLVGQRIEDLDRKGELIFESAHIAKNGKEIPVEVHSKIINYAGNKAVLSIARDISSRKSMESRIKLFSSIVDSSQEAIYTKDFNGNITSWNHGAELLYGYSAKEILGKNVRVLVPKNKNEDVSKILARVAKGESIEKYETIRIAKDGKKLDVSLTISPVYDQDTVIGSSVIAYDISKEKMAREAIVEAKEKYESLYEKSSDAIMVISPPDWRFISGNRAAINMFHVNDEKEFVSLGPWELSPKKQPDGQLSSDKAKKMIEIALKKGSNFFEWTHQRYRGEPFPATVLLTRMNINGKEIIQATVRDITKEKQLLDKLGLFKKYFDNSPNSMILAEYDGGYPIIRMVNDSFTNFYGYSAREVVGKTPKVLKSGLQDQKFYKALWKSVLNPKIGMWSGKVVNKRKDGSTIQVHLSITTFFDEKNNPRYFMAHHIDLKKMQLDNSK